MLGRFGGNRAGGSPRADRGRVPRSIGGEAALASQPIGRSSVRLSAASSSVFRSFQSGPQPSRHGRNASKLVYSTDNRGQSSPGAGRLRSGVSLLPSLIAGVATFPLSSSSEFRWRNVSRWLRPGRSWALTATFGPPPRLQRKNAPSASQPSRTHSNRNANESECNQREGRRNFTPQRRPRKR